MAHQEKQIGGPLREPPHEVSIPLPPVRNVKTYPPALPDQHPLELPTDAVEQLEFEAFGRNAACAREALRGRDEAFVVRSNGVIDPAGKEPFRELLIAPVHIALAGKSDIRRFLVSAFYQPDAHPAL